MAGCISMMGCTIIVNKQAAPSIAAPTATPERTPASSVKPAFDLNSTSDDVDQGSAYGQFAAGVIDIDRTGERTWPPEVHIFRPTAAPAPALGHGPAKFDALQFVEADVAERSLVFVEADIPEASPQCARALLRSRFYLDQASPGFAEAFEAAWAACPGLRHGSDLTEARGFDRMQYVKDLTEGAATKVVSVVVEPGQSVSGMVSYVVSAVDMSPGRRYQHQARAGHVSFTVTNDGGVESCAVTGDDRGENPTERSDGSSLVATDGVMGYAWATSTYPKNGCELTLNAWSSLQQTQFQIFAVTSAIYSGQSNAVWVDPRDAVTPRPASWYESEYVFVAVIFLLMLGVISAADAAVGIWRRSR